MSDCQRHQSQYQLRDQDGMGNPVRYFGPTLTNRVVRPDSSIAFPCQELRRVLRCRSGEWRSQMGVGTLDGQGNIRFGRGQRTQVQCKQVGRVVDWIGPCISIGQCCIPQRPRSVNRKLKAAQGIPLISWESSVEWLAQVVGRTGERPGGVDPRHPTSQLDRSNGILDLVLSSRC